MYTSQFIRIEVQNTKESLSDKTGQGSLEIVRMY